jgi:large subunit ribosomal protein L29
MKAAEIRELPDDELLSQLEGLKEELFNLRFQVATGQLDNPMRIKQVRHDAARMLTVLRERHLEEELELEVAAADRRSLEERRAAIASGELKGTPLAEVEVAPGEGGGLPGVEAIHERREEEIYEGGEEEESK